MSRKKGGTKRTAPFVFVGLGAAVAAALALWITGDVNRASREAEAAARNVPILPAGPLQFVMSNSNEATYLALDSVRRDEDLVTATVLKVGRTTTSIEGGGALVSTTAAIDCDANRIFDGKVGAFDVDGRLVSASAGFSGKHGRVVEPSDYQVAALCKGEKGRVVPDLQTAQRESQALPDAVLARAEADAKAVSYTHLTLPTKRLV